MTFLLNKFVQTESKTSIYFINKTKLINEKEK